MLICPVCKSKLNKIESSYHCENNHCFDISKKGYVNLLMSQSKKTKTHGDDKLMAKGRRDFLDTGHYSKLLDELIKKTSAFKNIVDVGCGEGYYTCGIAKKDNQTIGIDISKDIVSFAASRGKDTNVIFAVAGCSQIPVNDGGADCIISIFAPVHSKEFDRILAYDGVIVRVVPGKKHLFELKQAIYDEPRYNESLDLAIDYFEVVSSDLLEFKFTVNNAEIQNLFSMTPYYYRTSRADKERLKSIESLDVTAEFNIIVYKKKNDC